MVIVPPLPLLTAAAAAAAAAAATWAFATPAVETTAAGAPVAVSTPRARALRTGGTAGSYLTQNIIAFGTILLRIAPTSSASAPAPAPASASASAPAPASGSAAAAAAVASTETITARTRARAWAPASSTAAAAAVVSHLALWASTPAGSVCLCDNHDEACFPAPRFAWEDCELNAVARKQLATVRSFDLLNVAEKVLLNVAEKVRALMLNEPVALLLSPSLHSSVLPFVWWRWLLLLLWLTPRVRRRFDSSRLLFPRSYHDDGTRFVEVITFHGRHHFEFNAVARKEPLLTFQRRMVDEDF
eukprot:COSAG04_NODE_1680_length_5962_cov_2.562170_4_plen_302_part_00